MYYINTSIVIFPKILSNPRCISKQNHMSERERWNPTWQAHKRCYLTSLKCRDTRAILFHYLFLCLHFRLHLHSVITNLQSWLSWGMIMVLALLPWSHRL